MHTVRSKNECVCGCFSLLRFNLRRRIVSYQKKNACANAPKRRPHAARCAAHVVVHLRADAQGRSAAAPTAQTSAVLHPPALRAGHRESLCRRSVRSLPRWVPQYHFPDGHFQQMRIVVAAAPSGRSASARTACASSSRRSSVSPATPEEHSRGHEQHRSKQRRASVVNTNIYDVKLEKCNQKPITS